MPKQILVINQTKKTKWDQTRPVWM